MATTQFEHTEKPNEEWLSINAQNLAQYTLEVDGKTLLDFAKLFATNQHPVLSNLTLDMPLQFPEHLTREFPKGISFINVTFENDVILKKALFQGPLYFWDCRFQGIVNFFRCKVMKSSVYGRVPGEVNFSYCRFGSANQVVRPSFDRAEFEGEAFFHRTVFPNGADFAGTKFSGGAIFESAESDICLSKEALNQAIGQDAKDFINVMYKRRILQDSAYSDAHFNFDRLIMSRQSLESRLAQINDSVVSIGTQRLEAAKTAICELWCERYSTTMFGVPFSGWNEKSSFEHRTRSTFREAFLELKQRSAMSILAHAYFRVLTLPT